MKKVDIDKIYSILKKETRKYKVPIVDLIKIKSGSAFNVLLGTILSARTKDETTAVAAKKLFSKVKNFEDLKSLSVKEIEQLIYPVGFFRNKARYLKELPSAIKKEFNSVIPETVDELVKLPGVGRKTANLVVAVGFQKPAVCVDVHVNRIMNRFGYLKTKTPFETEMVLRKKLPIKYWEKINSMLVAFGQHLCTPVSPWCSRCPIIDCCNQIGFKTKR
ncbi:endonuclease III [Candidatus Woesearchaeota archaeon]|jgi:endonuclease III|nr:endonuclease III [Candidatus Woesearchaeota archaeon]